MVRYDTSSASSNRTSAEFGGGGAKATQMLDAGAMGFRTVRRSSVKAGFSGGMIWVHSLLGGAVSGGCGWLFGLFPDADEAGKYERALSIRSRRTYAPWRSPSA